jgi:branched-chain amino acid transport system substrate-binding protein
MQRRTLLASLAAAALPCRARAEGAPLRIGVLNDMSGVYADYQGAGSVIAARLAAEDFGGGAAGHPIEIVSGDHQNQPDVGAAIARRWFDTEGIAMILDVPNSAVALAVAEIARQKNKLFIGSGAGTDALTGTKCSPNTIHWTYDTWEAGHALARAVLARGGRKWFFITADYAFGHVLESNMADEVRAGGGEVVGAARHPLGATDYASYLVQAQTSGADVLGLANAGGDMSNTLKQAAEFGLGGKITIAGPVVNINNIAAVGLAVCEGLLAVTPFYWDMTEATRAFAARFAARHPHGNMPNDMQAGCYAATLAYLKAVASLGGADDGAAVAASMKMAPAEDPLFGRSDIRADGRVTHPVYLMQAKRPADSHGAWDVFSLLDTIPPDRAFRPLADGKCPLVKA